VHLTTTRIIDVPIDRLWSLQLDHASWPQHLPNFSSVRRLDPDAPFAVGSAAEITQPALGTVTWTVTELAVEPARRTYMWQGSAKGVRYAGSHLVEAVGSSTRMTLGIRADGPLISVLGRLVRGRMQRAIDDEAAAFERWAVTAQV
jgi:uncharacterized membrane protein